MKIFFVVHRYHTNLYFVVKALKNAGHELKIIVPEIEIYNTLIEDRSLIEPIKIKESELSAKYIYNFLKAQKPDLLILRYFEGKWILFSLISKLLGIKRVTYNQIPYYNQNWLKAKLKPYKVRLFRGQPLKRFTPVKGANGFKEGNTTYVPFPIEPLVQISDRKYNTSGAVRILCVGKLGQERKRHIFLLDALESINVKCCLTIIGADPNYALSDNKYFELLKKRSSETSLYGGVKILKDLPYQEILKQYCQHDIFVLPSVTEPFAISVLEALAAGCAVISSDDNGSSSYIEDGINGFIFKKNNIEDLVKKLRYLLHNPERISILGHNAIKRVKTEHSSAKFVKQIEELYYS